MDNDLAQAKGTNDLNMTPCGFYKALMPKPLSTFYKEITVILNDNADQLPPFLLRLILAYEFWEAGFMKYNGENWFNHIDFPLPFSFISNEILWSMATWFEIIGAIALVLGLGTRLVSISLIILTIVAAKAVHWPADWNTFSELWQGYAISNKGYGNFKLPLLYLIMFMPLLFGGAGRWSLDHILVNFCKDRHKQK